MAFHAPEGPQRHGTFPWGVRRVKLLILRSCTEETSTQWKPTGNMSKKTLELVGKGTPLLKGSCTDQDLEMSAKTAHGKAHRPQGKEPCILMLEYLPERQLGLSLGNWDTGSSHFCYFVLRWSWHWRLLTPGAPSWEPCKALHLGQDTALPTSTPTAVMAAPQRGVCSPYRGC